MHLTFLGQYSTSRPASSSPVSSSVLLPLSRVLAGFFPSPVTSNLSKSSLAILTFILAVLRSLSPGFTTTRMYVLEVSLSIKRLNLGARSSISVNCGADLGEDVKRLFVFYVWSVFPFRLREHWEPIENTYDKDCLNVLIMLLILSNRSSFGFPSPC